MSSYIFNSLQEMLKAYPQTENLFVGEQITKICYQAGLEYDDVFNIHKEYDQYSIQILQVPFIQPLIVEDNEIKYGSFRVMFKFMRVKNQQIVSESILNLLIILEDNSYKHIEYWLPGSTIVNLVLLEDIKPSLIASAIFGLEQKYNIAKEKQALELCMTKVEEFKDNEGWLESWDFVDLNTQKSVRVMAKFALAPDGGVNYDIYI